MAGLAHLGIGLSAKRFAPTEPLWGLLVSTCLLDILCFVFFFLGIEEMNKVSWSHSLLMAVIWSLLSIFVIGVLSRNKRVSLLIGFLVFSHWLVDFITWPTGPPLFPIEVSPELSLGLINFLYSSDIGMIIGILVIEFGSLILGIGIYILTKKRPSQTVEVIIHEIPKAHWGIDGKPATKLLKDAKPPI
ncbi:MAG: metal-dependent hydrolase [Promethearchaeota archaeon]